MRYDASLSTAAPRAACGLKIVMLVMMVPGLWLMHCNTDAPRGSVHVAVASNFSPAMIEIAGRFEDLTGYRVLLSPASTGKHYAQIRNGAPFDIFLAADSERPTLLEKNGRSVPGSRFTYALGRLILWSPEPGYVDSQGGVLAEDAFQLLAIANPDLAPYGAAAREVLKKRGLWERLERRMVRGENIAQAFQYVMSGNARLGFISAAQLGDTGADSSGSWWEVDRSLYTPIVQQAVLLRESEGGRQLWQFLQSADARGIIRKHGYDLP